MKVIVTTTVHGWGECLEAWRCMDGWELVVVGDRCTPHGEYRGREGIVYLSPEEQERLYPELSERIGWDCIQRRNVGFLYAYGEMGAEWVATVDDDNIPGARWGCWLEFDGWVDCCYYNPGPSVEVAEPLSVLTDGLYWHRGYPLSHVPRRFIGEGSGEDMKCMPDVFAGLWLGEPDIDAYRRMVGTGSICYDGPPFGFNVRYSVFNSQNTVLRAALLPRYCCLPGIGRFDDIWGGYLLQSRLGTEVLYGPTTVEQKRHKHDIVEDFRNELYGYRWTDRFLEDGCSLEGEYVPERTRMCWYEYKKAYDRYTG